MNKRAFLWVVPGVLAWVAAHGAVAVRLPLEDLVGNSLLVVRGQTITSQSFLDENSQRVMTRHRFQANEYLKGEGDRIIEVVTLGGELEDIGQIVPGEARLNAGEEVILCLRRGPAGYSVTGMSQGLFRVVKRPDDGEFLVRNLSGLLFVGEKEHRRTLKDPAPPHAPGERSLTDEIPLALFRELVQRQDVP